MLQKAGDAIRLIIALIVAFGAQYLLDSLPAGWSTLVSALIGFAASFFGWIILQALGARPCLEISWTSVNSKQKEYGRLELTQSDARTAAQIYEITARASSNSVFGRWWLRHNGKKNSLSVHIEIDPHVRFAREAPGVDINSPEQTVATLHMKGKPKADSDWAGTRVSLEVIDSFVNFQPAISYSATIVGKKTKASHWLKLHSDVTTLNIKELNA